MPTLFLFQLVSVIAEKLTDINSSKLLKEILVGACYSSVNKHISSDASDLLRLLPMTTIHSGSLIDEKVMNLLKRFFIHFRMYNYVFFLLWNPRDC